MRSDYQKSFLIPLYDRPGRLRQSVADRKEKGEERVRDEGDEQGEGDFKAVGALHHEREEVPQHAKTPVRNTLLSQLSFAQLAREHALRLLGQGEPLSRGRLDARRRPAVPPGQAPEVQRDPDM